MVHASFLEELGNTRLSPVSSRKFATIVTNFPLSCTLTGMDGEVSEKHKSNPHCAPKQKCEAHLEHHKHSGQDSTHYSVNGRSGSDQRGHGEDALPAM